MPVRVTVPVLGSLETISTGTAQSPQEQSSSRTKHHRLASQEETASLSDLDNDADADADSASSSPSPSHGEEGDGLVVMIVDEEAHKTTERQAFVHLLKGYVGPGCLSLPWAVSQMGIWWGCLAIAALAYWTSYNCWVVVRLKLRCLREQQQQNQQNNNNISSSNVTYPDLARWLWGRTAQALLTAAVCVQQLAVCTVFLSFLGVNLQAVLEGIVSVPVHHAAVITAALPAVLALVCVPDLKALAPFILVATVLLLVGLALLMSLVAVEWSDRPDHDSGDAVMGVQWSTVPLAICAILYSFEGVCLILPVQSSMKRPQNFGPVFVGAMTASAAIFCLVAGLCVMAFGNVTSGSITAFLLEKYSNATKEDNRDSEHLRSLLLLANAAVSFSVLVTYPLQLFPCFELVGPLLRSACCCNIKNRVHSSRGRRRRRHVQLTTVTQMPSGERADFAALASDDEHEHDGSAVGGGGGDDTIANHRSPSAADGNDDELGLSDHTATDEATAAASSNGSSGDTPMGRMALVMVTYILAIAVPNVEAMISLAGALAGSIVALLVPPAMHIAYQRRRQLLLIDQQQQTEPTNTVSSDTSEGVTRSYLLFVAGFVFMVIGTGASILDIVEVYSRK